MRTVIQVVKNAKVEVEQKTVGQIDNGYLILVGFNNNDTKHDVEFLVNKIVNLRIFEDDNQKMNLSIKEVNGKILSISQFTLYANWLKGRRPSFIDAAKPEIAQPLYEYFNERLKDNDIMVETGVFGAMMNVTFTNTGPVTIIMDSNDKK